MRPGKSGAEDGLSPAVGYGADPFWRDRRVLITGHTGFIGGWLSLWLRSCGAEVYGYALPPPSEPSFHEAVGLGRMVRATIGDIRDRTALAKAVTLAAPDVVFHLAAQPLVPRAYEAPIETLEVNVIGTANLLQVVRDHAPRCRATIVMTSDKVYANRDDGCSFDEHAPLGANEVYGASKAATELTVEAYRRSYFAARPDFALTTVRAGNAIGGGDWAAQRIVPDAIRAYAAGRPLEIRNPTATRPWQHVLEIVSGLLLLGRHLLRQPETGGGAWNLGPASAHDKDVAAVADALARCWSNGARWEARNGQDAQFPESRMLAIDSSKASTKLGWRPMWSFEQMIEQTVEWYLAYYFGGDCLAVARRQIDAFRDGHALIGNQP